MNAFTKIGNLIDGLSAMSAGKKAVTDMSPASQAWINGMDLPDSEKGAQIVSPYVQSAWVYIAVSAIAEAVSQVPFRISRVSKDKAKRVRMLRGSQTPAHRDFVRRELDTDIVEDGEVVELFNRPHKTQNATLFWELVASYDAMRGEFFIVPLDDQERSVDLTLGSARVASMLNLPTDMFWHLVTGYELTGWRFTGSPLVSPIPSEMFLPSEVCHGRNVNPYLYWRGMSPISVAMLAASADYAAAMFQKGLLMNNADTGVIATTDQQLTQEQREQFMAALRERKRKAGTPDRPLFLSNGVKIEKPTISNVDMQFLETRKLLRQEIGAIFKVPESIMGFSEAKSSALSGGGNALESERLGFYCNNIAPRCRRYECAVAPIISTFDTNLIGWFDIDSLPIMQEARRAKVDTAVKLFNIGIPLNQLNQVYDLGFEPQPWGDTGFLPFSVQPADLAANSVAADAMPGEDLPTGADDAAGDDGEPTTAEDDADPFSKMARFLQRATAPKPQTKGKSKTTLLWESHMRRRNGDVKAIYSKVSKVLNIYRGKTLEKLNHIHLNNSFAAGKRDLVDLIFSPHEFGNELFMVLHNPLVNTFVNAGMAARKEIGKDDPWTMPAKAGLEYISKRKQEIMGVGGTVREQINTALIESAKAGESADQMAVRVKGVFNSLQKYEAMRVARTETNMAFNDARHVTFTASGIEYKQWLSSHGPNVRDGHAEAESDYGPNSGNIVPLSEPFEVRSPKGIMERMLYPGDSSLGASAGNVINCQCLQLPARQEDGDPEGKTFFVYGLGIVKEEE